MDWRSRVHAACEPGFQPDDDVVEELAQHAEASYQAALADGADSSEASRQVNALIDKWTRDPDVLRKRPRRAPAVMLPPPASSRFAGVLQDVRYGWRILRRQPWHALTAIFTMALGIGATATLFSVAYGVLFKPFPWPDADRLVRLYETRQGSTRRFRPVMTNGAYLAWQDPAPSTTDAMGAWSSSVVTLRGAGDPARVRIAETTPGILQILGGYPAIGSWFQPGDAAVGREEVTVLSYGLWQERFGGRPDIAGRTIQFDEVTYRILGVMAQTFVFPDREARAWVPLRIPPVINGTGNGRTMMMFNTIARLKPGVSPAQAAAEGTARARSGPDPGMVGVAVFGSKGLSEVSAIPLKEAEVADVRPALMVFLAAVGLLLLAAIGNVASLQLARAAGRRREVAIRSALGAGGMRLARQFLVESVLLGLSGGFGGLLIAGALHRVLPTLLPPGFPRLHDITLDWHVVAFAFGVSFVASLAFGVLPALEARRVNVVSSLAEDGVSPAGGGMRSRTSRTRSIIMTGQVAIACVLLVGASLLMRTFTNLLNADLGYNPDNVLTADLNLPDSVVGTRQSAVLQAVLERLRTIPGVTTAGATSGVPLSLGTSLASFRMTSGITGSQVDVQVGSHLVSPGYFAAIGLRVLRGRGFTDADLSSATLPLVVNRAFVNTYLGEPAVGKRLPWGNDANSYAEIIGVVENVHQRGATDPVAPEIYNVFRQGPGSRTMKTDTMTLVVRTTGDPLALVPALRGAIHQQDPSLVVDGVQTMDGRLRTSLARPRLYAVLLGGFAIFALVIAGVGLFGVLAYNVAQRSREIGVRTALGARPYDILALVLRQGLTIAAAGLAVGLVVSAASASAMAKLLYGVTAYDPITFIAVSVFLLGVAASACFIPAARAARLNPVQALRGRDRR